MLLSGKTSRQPHKAKPDEKEQKEVSHNRPADGHSSLLNNTRNAMILFDKKTNEAECVKRLVSLRIQGYVYKHIWIKLQMFKQPVN